MTAYEVTVTRADDLWVATAASTDGAHVGVLDFDSFDDLHETMPEYIADMTDADPADVMVIWRYEVAGQDVTVHIRHLTELEDQLRRTKLERDRARSAALEALAGAGLSQRVMADVLHVSPQRVHQLVSARSQPRAS